MDTDAYMWSEDDWSRLFNPTVSMPDFIPYSYFICDALLAYHAHSRHIENYFVSPTRSPLPALFDQCNISSTQANAIDSERELYSVGCALTQL